MTFAKREYIRKFTQIISEKLNLSTPIELNELEKSIKNLGGEIRFSSELGKEKDAEIKRCKENGKNFIITINKNKFTSDERKKFTLAHELGHLFLHMKYANEEEWEKSENYEDVSYARLGYSENEFEAHEFAATLLMPEKEYKEQIQKHKDKTNGSYVNLKEVAEYFGVSFEAAMTRGEGIGVIERQ